MNSYRGSISIYFVFAIVLIISVILSVTEIARINCQKLYLQIATDSALDSMASLYHRKLYKYYSLYGVEYRTNDELVTEYLEYMYPYFMNEDRFINNWYIADIDHDNIELDISTLTDETNLEKEILKYTKYKLIGKTIRFLGKEIFIEDENDSKKLFEEADSIFKEVEKSDLYSEIHERYFNFSEDIKLLESYARKISDYVDKVNLSLNSIKSMGIGGSKANVEAVLRKFNELKDRIDNLEDNLRLFKEKMENFRQVVNSSYERYENDKSSGNYEFNDEIIEFIESEFDHFLSFVDENSDMNRAVEEGFNNCSGLVSIVDEDYINIETYYNEHLSLEKDLREARSNRGDDYDSDEVKSIREDIRDLTKEVGDYLKDVRDSYKEVVMERIQIIVSSNGNNEKEGLLKKLIGFKDGILLNLIVDSETLDKVSKEEVNYLDFNIMSNNNFVSLDKVILGEYELDKFNYFNKEQNNELTMSGSTKYEVERLITGKNSDLECLKGVVNQILLIRIAMDVLHIYKSSEKRNLARQFTAAIFGGFSPLMVEVMFLLTITAWGTAQAISDLKKLMDNKRVNFMHDDNSWTVSVESIFNVASGNIGAGSDDDIGNALSYKDYLRLLLIKTKQTDVNERMASIIDRNIKDEQTSFDFEKLIYSFDVENTFHCKHFFTNFVFVPAKDVTLYDKYIIKSSGYRCFYDSEE